MADEKQSSLFVPESEGLSSLTAPAKKTALSGLTSSPSRKIGLVILTVALVYAISHYSRAVGSWKSGSTSNSYSHQDNGPKFGPDKIPVTTEYEGCQPVYNEHGVKFVDGSMVAKNVPWEIQYDGDPAKRYAFPPYNTPGTNTFVYRQPCRYWQIRILPNPEGKTKGEYAFVRAPR